MKPEIRSIRPAELNDNVFKLMGTDRMLIAAGTKQKFNMMTAGWGGLGILWGMDVCFCFVRPSRYTFKFLEQNERFSLCFFDQRYKNALELCGTKSGRDMDKAALAGLTPAFSDSGTVYFTEARLCLECKKIYFHDIDPSKFLDAGIVQYYPSNDYHRMYVGRIEDCRILSE